jgi:hypothetical protein
MTMVLHNFIYQHGFLNIINISFGLISQVFNVCYYYYYLLCFMILGAEIKA